MSLLVSRLITRGQLKNVFHGIAWLREEGQNTHTHTNTLTDNTHKLYSSHCGHLGLNIEHFEPLVSFTYSTNDEYFYFHLSIQMHKVNISKRLSTGDLEHPSLLLT